MTDTTARLLAQINDIKARFEADPQGLLASTTNLKESDFALMGKIIQLYCYADLNARRIIDALRHAAIGQEARNASRLRDAQVFPELREITARLWESDLKEGLFKAAETVEMHRIHRHNFAHWAARRIDNAEALILFTKNSREAERRNGMAPEPDQLTYAIVPISSFDEEIKKLDGHGQYLAEAAVHVERYIEEFRVRFAEMDG